MKILQVCKKFPYPVMDGEGVAVRALARGLVEAGCTLDLLSFNTSKHRVHEPQRADLPHYRAIYHCDLDNEVHLWRAAASVLRSGSYHVSRFISEDFRRQLKALLVSGSYDAVILETSILAIYIPTIRAHSDARVLLRAHNLEHEIWERIGERKGPLVGAVYRVFARRLRRFEREWIGKCDLLLPITERDGEQFRHDLGYRGPMHVVPVGYESDPRAPRAPEPLSQLPFAISFIGSLDWAPNREGLHWFLRAVWPRLREHYPDLQFHIAGRKTPPEILGLRDPGVYVHGEVDDSRRFLQRFPMTVAPILSGSGTRVKILDAMAAGRVVLSTTMGLEGIAAVDRETVLVCRSPSAFVDQVRYVREAPARLDALGANARDFIEREFDFARIGFGVASQIRDLRLAGRKLV